MHGFLTSLFVERGFGDDLIATYISDRILQIFNLYGECYCIIFL